MVLPNIEISPILEMAWAVLQFAIRWTVVLSLMVFLAVIVAGAGDMLAKIVNRKGRKSKKKVSRVKE